MSTVSIWILVAVSTGYYNKGNVSVIDRFATHNDCKIVAQSIRNLDQPVALLCTEAKVLKL